MDERPWLQPALKHAIPGDTHTGDTPRRCFLLARKSEKNRGPTAYCLGERIPEYARNAPIPPNTASVMQGQAPTSFFRTENHSFSIVKSSFLLTFRWWCNITQGATIFACSFFLVRLESIYGLLDLGAQIRAVKCFLIHFLAAILAVPAKTIETTFGSWLLNHNTDCIGETHGVVWCVGR